MARRYTLVTAVVCACWIGACTPLIDNHGYVPTDLELSEVVVGDDTKDTVAEKVGRPPLDDLQRPDVWYYVATRRETIGWNEPVETDRQVVAISFAEGGAVTNIERFGLERGQVVTLSRRVTDQSVPDVGFIRGLFRNTTLAPDLNESNI